MSESANPGKLASLLSEEVLRKIYGDDFTGCATNPDDLARVIEEGLTTEQQKTRELVELYEKVVEAVHLLSTPPDSKSVTDPAELHALLSQRVDTIHTVTTRTIETTSRVGKQSS